MSSPTPSGPPPDTPRRDDGRGKLAEVFTDDEEQSLAFCRVCWAPDDSAALLSPCLCSGGLVPRASPPNPIAQVHSAGAGGPAAGAGGPAMHCASACIFPAAWAPCMRCSTLIRSLQMKALPTFVRQARTSFACHLLSGTILPRPLPLPSFYIRLQAPKSMYTSNACGGGRRACRSGTASTVRAAATPARSC